MKQKTLAELQQAAIEAQRKETFEVVRKMPAALGIVNSEEKARWVNLLDACDWRTFNSIRVRSGDTYIDLTVDQLYGLSISGSFRRGE